MILGVNQKIHFKTKGKFKGGFFLIVKKKLKLSGGLIL